MKTYHARLKGAVLCAMFWLLFAPGCFASADPFLDGQIKNLEHKIISWEKDGHLVGGLIFAVFFIGLAVAALQAATTRTMKIIAAVLSFFSAAIVGYYHQFFPADDRTYDKAVRLARSKLNAFTYELLQYPSLDQATETALHKRFAELITQIEQIENATIYNAGGASASEKPALNPGAILLPSLHAQPSPEAMSKPAWADKVPEDDKNLYFVGTATGKTFDEARQNALSDGQQAAAAKFTRNAKTSAGLTAKPELVEQLVKALAGVTEAAETFVAPDPASGGYRGYALLRLPRSAARFTAESIFVQKSVPYDNAFLDRLQKETNR